jgi:hypothetical protein
MPDESHPVDAREQLELSDLLSRVLDKGVLIHGTVLISVADVDLVRLGLSVMLTAVETERRRQPPPGTIARAAGRLTALEAEADGHLAVRPPPGVE